MAEAIGNLVVGAVLGTAAAGFTIGATSITLGYVVGTAIIVGGSIGAQMLLSPAEAQTPLPQQNTPTGRVDLPTPEAGHVPLRQSIPPRTVAYGRVRLAGTYVLFEAKLGISWDVIAFHHGQIANFAGFYLHDDVVTLTTLTGGTVQGLSDGRYSGDHINIDTRLGFATNVAYPQPVAAMPDIWTDAHRGDGLASLMMQCLPVATADLFPDIYPRGKPEPSVVVDATPIFDARFSVFFPSQNPIIQLIDYLTNDDYGMGLDYATLITPVQNDILLEANICDEIFTRNDGQTEFRYKSCGSFQIDSDPADVVTAILDTCDGWISENGDGTLSVRVGKYRTPTVTFESKHIRGINLQYDVADEEIINELSIDYCEPLADYKTVPAQPWRNETDIAERGRVRSQRLSLPWVQSFTQARRLAKRRDAQNNAALRGTLTTTLYGLRALGERWVRVQAPDLPDLANLVIEVRGVTIDLLNSSLTFRFISINENEIDDWVPGMDGAQIVIPPKLISVPAPPVGGGDGFPDLNPVIGEWTVTWTVPSPGNPGSTSFAFLSFDDPHRFDLTWQVQWRFDSAGPFTLEPNRAAVASPIAPGKIGIYCLFTELGAFGGRNYEVQIRSVPNTGGEFASAFSASLFIHITG